ncbi:hypothetical protein [Amycolatopsis sp. cg13]|uniref:hypothetical protein n=1 Tax=Amycolatopsis sp. cg13 TaxID=3238807 RepID=UPI003525F880
MSDPIEEAALYGGTAAEIALSAEGAISAGRLAAGCPPVRDLAARLAVSPATARRPRKDSPRTTAAYRCDLAGITS